MKALPGTLAGLFLWAREQATREMALAWAGRTLSMNPHPDVSPFHQAQPIPLAVDHLARGPRRPVVAPVVCSHEMLEGWIGAYCGA